MISERMGICGLDCVSCDLYRLPSDEQIQARFLPWFRRQGWLGEDERIDVVIEKKMYCKGCGDADVCWSSDCKLASCCRERGLQSCAYCADFICDLLRQEHMGGDERYLEGIRYLRAIREGKQRE